MVGIAVGIVVVAAGVGVALSSSRGPVAVPAPPQTAALGARPQSPGPQKAATVTSSGEVVHFDALPLAPAKARAADKRGGTLVVGSRGGHCRLEVDGVAHGGTPAPAIALPPGKHTVRCSPPGKAAKITTVSIERGKTTRHVFQLD